jgi:predicted ester cyclase
MQNLKEIVAPFYNECLTVNATVNLQERLAQLLADDFQSLNAAGVKDKATLSKQIEGFWKLMPNLKWEIQEMIQEGNKVVVRSVFSASPKGSFMGIECDGSKSFKTMSIDIHTVENGQIKSVYHCEEWSTAMAQLKA